MAVSNDFNVSVIYFEINNWSKHLNDKLKSNYNSVKYISLPTDKSSFIPWFLSSIIHIISKYIYFLFPKSLYINSIAHNKRSVLILNEFKKIKNNCYDLIVAHNLGSLYPAYKFSKIINRPFHFDIEDYHPGERIASDVINEVKRREYLLNFILPHAKLITYASPEIGAYTLKNIGNIQGIINLHIPNCFKSEEFSPPLYSATKDKLKLVWFSQFITYDRGLEQLLQASIKFISEIEIHLYGCLDPQFAGYLATFKIILTIHSPLPQIRLHSDLKNYDIGLALEIKSVDVNKNIAISNKIYSYAQSGLFILATDTSGQYYFINNYPWSGLISSSDKNSLESNLNHLIKNKDIIRKSAIDRFNLAKEIAWESCSGKLLDLWSKI